MKKTNDNLIVVAPASGKVIPLEQVEDPSFCPKNDGGRFWVRTY